MHEMLAPDLSAMVMVERVALRIPSRPEWVTPTVDYLKQRAIQSGVCSEHRAGKLMLALHEALTNSIIHGNLELSSDLKESDDHTFADALAHRCADPNYASRSVIIEIDLDCDRCRWILTDQGKGFNIHKYQGLEDSPDPEVWLSSGRGIMLMRSFVDEVTYELGGRRVILTLRRVTPEDRRRHERLPVQHRVEVAPIRTDGSVDWEATHEAVTRNLSRGGVGLLQESLALTDRLLLGVETQGQIVFLPAQVRHCRPVTQGTIELGCEFVEEEPELRSNQSASATILDRAIDGLLRECREAATPSQERRSHPREAYTRQIEVHGPPGTPPLTAFSRDLSRGGIAFISTRPIPLESRVLSLPQEGWPSLLVRVQITRCEEVATGFYDVGARFLALEKDQTEI